MGPRHGANETFGYASASGSEALWHTGSALGLPTWHKRQAWAQFLDEAYALKAGISCELWHVWRAGGRERHALGDASAATLAGQAVVAEDPEES